MRTKFYRLAQLVVAGFLLAGCATTQEPASGRFHSTQRGFREGCIFCQIASGAIQKERVVYQDETVVAFMDRAPRNPGHVLIVPLDHASDILDVPQSTLGHMAEVAQLIAKAIKSTDLRAEGFNLISNTGAAAGQSVFHLHLHVIPRFQGEPPHLGEKEGIRPDDELKEVAAKLRTKLNTYPK